MTCYADGRETTVQPHTSCRRRSAPFFAHGLPIETEKYLVTQLKDPGIDAGYQTRALLRHGPAAPVSIPECGFTGQSTSAPH